MFDFIINMVDQYPIPSWVVMTCAAAGVSIWLSLTWEAFQILMNEEKHGGLDR